MALQEQLIEKVRCAGLGTAVAVGTFDGVHLGHRKLLAALKDEARKRGIASVAVTFRQQPRSVVNPALPVSYLCDFAERLELLNSLGLDCVADVDFDDSVRYLNAEQFLSTLVEAAGLRVLVIGPNARQGHDRLGHDELQVLGSRLGVDVISAEPATTNGHVVSSSAVREALREGRMGDAKAMLGRWFSLTGEVLPGDGRGSGLGFPTANLGAFKDAALPEDGIYATWAQLGDRNCMAATSIGTRPTFGEGLDRRVEAYLLDFDGDLYSRRLRLEFVRRLRGEVAFESVKELVEQMHRDVEDTRRVLGSQT